MGVAVACGTDGDWLVATGGLFAGRVPLVLLSVTATVEKTSVRFFESDIFTSNKYFPGVPSMMTLVFLLSVVPFDEKATFPAPWIFRQV